MARTPGSGIKKGTKHRKTLDKEAARDYVRQEVIKALRPMLKAQVANASGISYLVSRNAKTGKFVRVGAAMAELAQADEDKLSTIEVWEKDPNINAFADLLNRALGKPIEHVEMEVSGEVSIIEGKLIAARARLAAEARKGEA